MLSHHMDFKETENEKFLGKICKNEKKKDKVGYLCPISLPLSLSLSLSLSLPLFYKPLYSLSCCSKPTAMKPLPH